VAKKISQAEARALKRKVAELEQVLKTQRDAWLREWPNGIHLDSIQVSDALYGKLHVARKLKHAVVVTLINRNFVEFYACEIGGK